MPGRIRDEDVAAVRDRNPIADIVGEHVALRNAGGGNLKGLCPFHDEKSPSFQVSPAKGFYHCFGCGKGGDVFRFVMETENVGFTESVERLAAKTGIQLRYVDGPVDPKRAKAAAQRPRLLEINALAASFYAEQLRTPDAEIARTFLLERGFDEAAAEHFGCGFAPIAWDGLTKYLLAKRFAPADLVAAGVSREGQRGLLDRFRRRLLWPIREAGGDVVGFGARRLFDDDPIEAKYLNTPETELYKKSRVLYGLDLARKDMARQHKAVVVEGYTDVMACHLAGETTAVATCGTAFGDEHVAMLRRMLLDSDTYTGQVVFTFDGDEAGMKAAERAFKDDQKFMGQTFVAIEPNGLDPNDLRQKGGDVAVRDLIASRIPLVEYVLRATVGRFDLDTVEGREGALVRAVPLVKQIKDTAVRDSYAVRLAGLVGLPDPNRVVAMVRSGRDSAQGGPAPKRVVDDATVTLEREVLKVVMQHPGVAGPSFDVLPPEAFLVPDHRALVAAIAAAGGTAALVDAGAGAVELLPDPVKRVAIAASVEPLHRAPTFDVEPYVQAQLDALQAVVFDRQIATVKSRVQRMNPLEDPDGHQKAFAELLALEKHRRVLRERMIGAS
ncbi:DNA primase [Jatrophihabitans sp. YIM 134969]